MPTVWKALSGIGPLFGLHYASDLGWCCSCTLVPCVGRPCVEGRSGAGAALVAMHCTATAIMVATVLPRSIMCLVVGVEACAPQLNHGWVQRERYTFGPGCGGCCIYAVLGRPRKHTGSLLMLAVAARVSCLVSMVAAATTAAGLVLRSPCCRTMSPVTAA